MAYYKKKRDLSGEGGGRSERSSEPREIRAGDPVRYFVNIGSRDDFDWMQLKDFLKETLDLGRDDVFKVDVKEGFSFFNTDGEHTDKVMSILNGFDMNGRRINVEISKNDGGSNVKDVTITEEVVAVNAEALADLEEEVQEVSDQEKKADSEAIEMMHQEVNVLIDQEEKADSEVTVLQKENQVHFKEKKELQDVLKVTTDQQDVHLKLLKAEDLDAANSFVFTIYNLIIVIYTNSVLLIGKNGVFFT